MKKKQFIILVIIIILILAGVVGWAVFQMKKIGEESALKNPVAEQKEVFSVLGVVSEVNQAENFLMVKPNGQESEVKVSLSETTKLIKIDLSSGNQTEIKILDFKVGSKVFVKSKESIAGKTELKKIDFIQLLP